MLFAFCLSKSERERNLGLVPSMIHLPVSLVSRKGIISHIKAISPHFDFIFPHPRVMFIENWNAEIFVIQFFKHQQTLLNLILFHNIFIMFTSFTLKWWNMFNFQEVEFFPMVSWHNFLSFIHTRLAHKEIFYHSQLTLEKKNCWFVFHENWTISLVPTGLISTLISSASSYSCR